MAITKISSGVIAGNAIIAAGVAENAISSSEIASNAVDTTQINAGAVTSAKLDTNIDIAGTLDVTGVLTADSNVVIAGNLTVNGTTVTNSATNTTIEDALIELGTGTTGTPANDAGIVIERGDSDNAFIGWDESADGFIVGTGSFTGASTGDLTISTAPITTGALTASGLSYPTSDGSANQVLITNGSGTLSFSSLPIDGAVVSNYTATGDGSTTAFDTGINPQNEVNTWVFVGGVYQPKDTYSYSGSTITFSEAPANGEDIDITTGQVAGFDSAESVLGVYQATTTATDTYDTGLTASNENNTFVFLDGVYQPKTSYTFSGSTITFDANTPADMLLEVMATKTLSASAVTTSTIAANAVTSAKIVSDGVLTRHIAANAITGAEISSTSQITASTFTGALTGNVTGNVTGNLTGTVQTAAQTNITSVGTLSSLTVSGDLTVDTSTLYVDSTNNRVGIGTASPSFPLHSVNASTSYVMAETTGTSTSAGFRMKGDASADFTLFTTQGTNQFAIYDNANTAQRLTIDASGNVGIGTTSPTGAKLHVVGGVKATDLIAHDTTGINLQTSNGTKRLVVDNSGNVGIGNTTPSNNHANANRLVVGNGTAGGIANYVGTGTGWYAFSRDNANNTDAYDGGISYDGSRNLKFHTNAGTERLTINGAGDMHLGQSDADVKLYIGSTGGGFGGNASHNMRAASNQLMFNAGGASGLYTFEVNGSEKIRFPSSGGITFNGDTAAANALDDYEEGSHQATITPSSSGSLGLFSTVDDLNYVKIGQLVHVRGMLTCDFSSSPTGYFTISLPFAIGSGGTTYGGRSAGQVIVNGGGANVRDYIGIGIQGESVLRCYLGDGTGLQSDSAQAVTYNSDIYVNFTYRTD